MEFSIKDFFSKCDQVRFDTFYVILKKWKTPMEEKYF